MNEKTKLAFVTGTSSGIGLSLARSLVQNQWRVCGLSRRPAALEAEGYTHLQTDLADLENLPARVRENWQNILNQQSWQTVALVNNAALIGALRWMHQTEAGHLGRIFAVNAAAPAYLMGWLAKSTDSSQKIRVVNISSGAAHTPFPGLGDYSATKAALRLSGQTLAKELQLEGRTADQAAVFSYEPGDKRCSGVYGIPSRGSLLRKTLPARLTAGRVSTVPERFTEGLIQMDTGQSHCSGLLFL